MRRASAFANLNTLEPERAPREAKVVLTARAAVQLDIRNKGITYSTALLLCDRHTGSKRVREIVTSL